MMTPLQHALFTYIAAFEAERGYCPSFEEMRVALGKKSKSGIHRIICILEERGYIRRLHHRARAITTKLEPSATCSSCGFRGPISSWTNHEA